MSNATLLHEVLHAALHACSNSLDYFRIIKHARLFNTKCLNKQTIKKTESQLLKKHQVLIIQKKMNTPNEQIRFFI